MSPSIKYSVALPSNANAARASWDRGSGTPRPACRTGSSGSGRTPTRRCCVGASPTPRSRRAGRSAAGKLLPRKCPDKSLVPTKTICSRCIFWCPATVTYSTEANPAVRSRNHITPREAAKRPRAARGTGMLTYACRQTREERYGHSRISCEGITGRLWGAHSARKGGVQRQPSFIHRIRIGRLALGGEGTDPFRSARQGGRHQAVPHLP